MNSDSETTFISAFMKIFESLINNDKSLFNKNMNFKKKKLNAKTQYHLLNCINDDDQKLMSKQTTTKEI